MISEEERPFDTPGSSQGEVYKEPVLHAHYDSASRDCDGRYDHHGVYTNPDQLDEFDFEARILRFIATWPDGDVDVEVRLGFNGQGEKFIHMARSTDEGHESKTATFCDDSSCDLERSGQRDHTAESMGY